ncbi:MAG TPA: acetyl-CoA carboxylase, carboxyltransferase subunit beta [Candidatus Krumholzibacteria bacterium]|nr:acetyl-CoA carboxylase, carboxyltransferase subunit beta [Candidatus Krumholzibacteria bacterium]
MSWLHRAKQGVKIQRTAEKRDLPEGMWMKCPGCSEIIYRVELEKNLWVCNSCSYHFPLSARQYVEVLTDPESFVETYRSITSLDPLDFRDAKEKYRLKLKKTMLRTNLTEAVLTGRARLHGRDVVLGVFDFAFLGGSMGSVVGEKIARAGLEALSRRSPYIILSRSGGARMHESVLSLMQMAKTSAVLAKLHEARVPYVSIMSNPTTGGVSASFAALGDVILAEPKAQIGFAGPRVIRETINQELPPGFQTAEFVQECGFVDLIVHRKDLRSMLDRVLGFLCASAREAAAGKEPVDATVDAGTPSAAPLPTPEVAPSPTAVVELPETTPRQIGRHGPA